jgi:hypothetical protein
MQVFLPSPDYYESLFLLDKKRLGKQRVEAKQLIDTILDRPMANGKPRKGWYNHPAAVMYRQYIDSLIHYYNMSLAAFVLTGGVNKKLEHEPYVRDTYNHSLPWWLGVKEIHASHRGRLKFKGKLDVLSDRIKKFTGVRGPNKWLKENKLPDLNYFTPKDYQKCTAYLNLLKAPESQLVNYYDQFNWLEPDYLEYIWPGEKPTDPFKTKIDGKMVEMSLQQVQDHIGNLCQLPRS